MGVFEKIIIQGDEVLELIPQRAPIVMIDKVYQSTESSTVTGLLIKDDNIFCKNGLNLFVGFFHNFLPCCLHRIMIVTSQVLSKI